MKTIAKLASLWLVLAGLHGIPAPAWAVEKIKLYALFEGKAIFTIDGERRVLSEGETSPEGVRLLETDTVNETVTIEVDGKRRSLVLGVVISDTASADGRSPSVILWAEPNGFFHVDGSINGIPVRFLVDTGASSVAMNSVMARRLGIDYKNGQQGITSTAGGYVRSYHLNLRSVKVGDILLHNVEAGVIEGKHPTEVLLGMSFLGRLDLRRDGHKLEMIQRY